MSLTGRLAKTLVVAATALLLLAASAAATTRYAAPAGAGSAPCTVKATPCPIGTAVGIAEPGDDVELAPGDYTFGPAFEPAVQVGTGVFLHGESRTARSVIRATDRLAVRLLGGASAADLDIYSSDPSGSAGALSIEAGTADRVRAFAAHNYGCFVFNGTIRNSICSSSDPTGEGLGMLSAGSAGGLPLLPGDDRWHLHLDCSSFR